MKKYVINLVLAVVSLFTAMPGNSLESQFLMKNGDTEEIVMVDFVQVYDMTDEMFQEFMLGNLQNIVIEFPKDAQLPLEVFLEGELVTLVKKGDSPLFITFNKSIYLRHHKGKLKLSTDFHNWRPLEGFLTGNVQVGINMEEIKGPVLSLGAELFERASVEQDEK